LSDDALEDTDHELIESSHTVFWRISSITISVFNNTKELRVAFKCLHSHVYLYSFTSIYDLEIASTLLYCRTDVLPQYEM